ncbi:MAG: plasmid pRiA4b ORF-3 family protein, partial [Turicibacter sp.]
MKAYQLKITLQELETVWRRVVVPEGITFKALHDVIQYAMGWTDSHLYQFVI